VARSKNALKYNPQWRRLLEYFEGRYKSVSSDELPDKVSLPCAGSKKARSLQLEFNCFLTAVRHTASGSKGMDEANKAIFTKLVSTSMALKAVIIVPGAKNTKGSKKADDLLACNLEIYDCRETEQGDLVEGFSEALGALGNLLIEANVRDAKEADAFEGQRIRESLGDGGKVKSDFQGVDVTAELTEEELDSGIDLDFLNDD